MFPLFTLSETMHCRTTHGPLTVVDPNSPTELARQGKLYQSILQHTGSTFPPEYDTDGVELILDLACGAGYWALDAAVAAQQGKVIGVESNPALVQYARAQARGQRAKAVHFTTVDLATLASNEQQNLFATNWFDLINGWLLSSRLSFTAYSPLLSRCWELLRPGGTLQLLEGIMGESSSPACAQMTTWYRQCIASAGGAPTPPSASSLIALLEKPCWFDVQQRVVTLPLASELPSHELLRGNSLRSTILVFFLLIKPFLLQHNISAEDFERVYRQARLDMQSPNFAGTWQLVQIWARKSVRDRINHSTKW